MCDPAVPLREHLNTLITALAALACLPAALPPRLLASLHTINQAVAAAYEEAVAQAREAVTSCRIETAAAEKGLAAAEAVWKATLEQLAACAVMLEAEATAQGHGADVAGALLY